jgi:AraC-like DNA-binding protein
LSNSASRCENPVSFESPPHTGQLRFSDFDAIVAAIPDFDSEYLQLERGSVGSVLTRVELERLVALRFAEEVPGYAFRATAPDAATSLVFLGGSGGATRWRGSPVTPRTLLAYGPGAEHVGYSRGRLTSFSLHFGVGVLEAHAERLGYELSLEPRSARHVEPPPLAMDGLREVTQHLFNFAECARPSLEIPAMRRSHEEALLSAAVYALVPAAEISDRAATGHERAVRRAVEVLEARADDVVYIADLCDAAGVSERTLRSAFQRCYGVSPIRFLHLHRMKRARRALLDGDPRAQRVSEIAARYGFANLGRFAVEFRQLFGLSPSQLLRTPR